MSISTNENFKRRSREYDEFEHACLQNDIELVNHLAHTYNIRFEFDIFISMHTINRIFFNLCEYNKYFAMLKWFVEYFQLDKPMVIFEKYKLRPKHQRSRIRTGFGIICAHGYLEIAKWYVTTFKLKHDDVKNNFYYPLKMAQRNGHLSVVEWITDTFDIPSHHSHEN